MRTQNASAKKYIAALDIGICEAEWDDGSTERFAVGDGFVEVEGVTGSDRGTVRILTDFADDEGHIDVERAQRAEARARDRLGHRSEPDVDGVRAGAALRRAMMRLKITRRIGT